MHAEGKGTRTVIDELEKNLQLLPVHEEAARVALHRFKPPNQAPCGMNWHISRFEAKEIKGRMCKGHGHGVWQIASDSGLVSNVLVLARASKRPKNGGTNYL